MEDGIGLNIYRNHPKLAAKINPKLKAGVKVYYDSNLLQEWTWDRVKDFVFGLAQAALDGTEGCVLEPGTEPTIETDSTTVKGLKQHETTHTGEGKRFACNKCDQSYINAKDLKQHEKTHTEEKPLLSKTSSSHNNSKTHEK